MPLAYFTNDDDEYKEENAVIACIESVSRYHECSGPIVLRKQRGPTPQLNLTVNMPIQLPASINSQQLPAQIQQVLQQLQQTLVNQIQNVIAEEIKKQLPLVGIETKGEKIMWKEVK